MNGLFMVRRYTVATAAGAADYGQIDQLAALTGHVVRSYPCFIHFTF